MSNSNWNGWLVALVVTLGGMPACAILGPEEPEVERTYADALDLERVGLVDLLERVPLPGSYNISVYVVSINLCPEDSACQVPDGITIAESLSPNLPDVWTHIPVNRPDQFHLRQPYVLSIEAESAGWRHPETDQEVRNYRLLGYTHAE